MGLKSWRERQLARADALTARADRMDAARAEAKAEREAEAEAAAVEADRAWYVARARALGEDHDDLLERAARFGLALPAPERRRARTSVSVSRRASWLVAVPTGLERTPHGGASDYIDSYEEWRDSINVAEASAR